MKLKITFLLLLFISMGYSQVTNEGKPKSWRISDIKRVEPIVMKGFDLATLQKEDEANDARKDRPWRYGFEFLVDNNLQNSGSWHTLPNGDRVWRIRYVSAGAKTLNFLFSDFYMPKGANVYLYNNERTDLLGAYDAAQNNEKRVLGTWLVTGQDIWIEYYEPKAVKGQGKLEIFKVVHGYRTIGNQFKTPDGALNFSGDCNYDVDCFMDGINDVKNISKKAVGVVLVDNSSFCTGALVNNTAKDGTPYFLTADHCTKDWSGNDVDVSQWAFLFNWISPNPVCAEATNSTNNAPNFYQTISGAALRAKREETDFCLLEITSEIPQNWDVVFSGWNRSETPAASTYGIHHPSGDIMKVSRDFDPPVIDNSEGTFMWMVEDWDLGVTEGGSSGSPLFDNNGRIIGQLLGGSSECNGLVTNHGFDVYGRFGISWNAGSSASTRLKDWLDPNNSNPVTLDYKTNIDTASLTDIVQDRVKIFPNPSNGIYIITLETSAQYSLYGIMGQLVKTGEFTDGNNSIDISTTAVGIYILKITDSATGKSANFKLVKD